MLSPPGTVGPARSGVKAAHLKHRVLASLVGLLATSILLLTALAGSAPAGGPTPGLVAAYSFDEGSGSTLGDASGNGHGGTISGAAWATGHSGGALSFNGTNASVSLGSLGTFYQSGFTLEAWVKKQDATHKDVAVVGSWNGGGPMIWVDHLAGDYQLTLGAGMSSYLDSGHTPVGGQWQHLAATYDGTTARFYIDGAEIANRAAPTVGTSDVWRIGAYGGSAGGFFDGSIDDVRIYNRALSAAEVQTDMGTPVVSGGYPSTPGNLTITARNKTSLSLQWSASTGGAGVTGYNVYLNGSLAGTTTTATSFSFSGLTCGTSYNLAVEAVDAASNTSARATTGASTDLCAPPTGLVAAYSFDQGTGTTLDDASGHGHSGTISGATWTTGHSGTALSFSGSNASVDLGSLGTFYQSGFTLEAWVKKQDATRKNTAIVGSWNGGGPMLWVDHLVGHYELTVGSNSSNYLDSGQAPVGGQWQHIAATYDGTTARYYIDGVQVASRAASNIGSSDTWRIGAYGASPGGFFDGLIDDVRVYDHALTTGEVQVDMNHPVIPNGGFPTTPSNLAISARDKTSLTLQWSASTANAGIAGYDVLLNGTKVGSTTTATTFAFSGLTCGTSYQLGVDAVDTLGNVSAVAALGASTTLCAPPTGLVAAYSFDDGSGTSLSDGSGNGHTGTVSGATWAIGHSGSALSFNGTNASVSLGSLGTFYQSGFTLEAWVKKAGTKTDAAVVGSWNGDGPMLWVDHLVGHYQLTLGGSLSTYLDSGRTPTAGQWQHLAATYDGTTARYYIDGVQVASRAASTVGGSNVWRIGAYGGSPGGFFDGLIDDIRIYNHALSGAEVQTDMNQPVVSDVQPPSAPGTLSATGGLGHVNLTWGAATDNVGVVRYDLYRSTSSGFTPAPGNRIAQPTGTSYADNSLPAGTYYYKVAAEDAEGNIGASSNQASATATADTTAPTVAITAPAAGTVSGPTTINASASDNVGVVGVQFKLDGQNMGAEQTASPFSLAWDTRGEVNGAHTLTAVARDAGGNSTTSAPIAVTVNNAGPSTAGLRGAWSFDEGTGSLAADASGNNATGTIVNGTWAGGRYGGAAALAGNASEVDLPALGTFYKTGFTLEAWVYKQSAQMDKAVLGSWQGDQGGGAMIWIDHVSGHYRLTLGNTFSNYLDSGVSPAVGQWQHVAATYDGTTARIYVDGVQAASTTFTGNVGNSNVWRIGAYGTTPTAFFDGSVDNVRIYDRALSGTEITDDMASRIQPDATPPTVTARTPADGATEVGVSDSLTAKFSEAMRPSTINGTTFKLEDPSNAVIPAAVTYDASTRTATLTPQAALQFDTVYHAVLAAGGPMDLAGNTFASDVTWSYTTQAAKPPILLLTSASNPFSSYLGEILHNEGLNDYVAIPASFATPSLLSGFEIVLVGDFALTSSQVSMLTTWVNAGGDLIAMRPDKQLAGLLGVSDAGSTLANAYLKVDTTTAPGAGIVSSTIQYHGSADVYTLSGASAVATLYSDATDATANPAVTMRSVGSNGGHAAAFTFDLARSVVYTRQGNPAWVGQDRDTALGIRPDDLFFGAKPGDVQPDWLDTSKIAIPQADEEQRLLVNMMTTMVQDKLPLPHFWYLPRGDKAVVVLSGDDHSPTSVDGATASNFDRLKQLSPPGCVVADWQCVRSTSYILPGNPMTQAQVAGYLADGFEIGLHPSFGNCPATPVPLSTLSNLFDTQLAQLAAQYPNLPSPVSSRTHCVYWPDWIAEPKVELAHGIRLDTNFYHYPASWIGDKPGFMNGGGFPMRFADLDGTAIDVFQQNTNMTDESGQVYPDTVDSLLDNALNSNGFYGVFGANIHTDFSAPQVIYEQVVAAAQARNVPLISEKQLLTWVDGRNSSTLSSIQWSAGTLTFTTTVASGANGLQTMLPVHGPSGTLSAITRNGSGVSFTVQTIKGIQYAMFDAVNGTYHATYS
jgi:chitodextrinase